MSNLKHSFSKGQLITWTNSKNQTRIGKITAIDNLDHCIVHSAVSADDLQPVSFKLGGVRLRLDSIKALDI